MRFLLKTLFGLSITMGLLSQVRSQSYQTLPVNQIKLLESSSIDGTDAKGSLNLRLGYGLSRNNPIQERSSALEIQNQPNYNLGLLFTRKSLGLELNAGIGAHPYFNYLEEAMNALGVSVAESKGNGKQSTYLTLGPSIRILNGNLGWALTPSVGLLYAKSKEIQLLSQPNQTNLITIDPVSSKIRSTLGLGTTLDLRLNRRFGVHLAGQYQTTHLFKRGEGLNLESLLDQYGQNPQQVGENLLYQKKKELDFSQLNVQAGISIYLGSGNSTAIRGSFPSIPDTIFSIPIGVGKCVRKCMNEKYKACRAALPDCNHNYRNCVAKERNAKKACLNRCKGLKGKSKRRCKNACRETFREAKRQCKSVRENCRALKCRRLDFKAECDIICN